MQPQAQKNHAGKVLVSFIIVALISVGFWQRQNILDAWKLRGYEPSVKIASLSTRAGMSDNGRKIFYVTHPKIQQKAEFYKSCEDGEASVVLGCYKPKSGIYILEVDDPRLAGVEEVTAAHEMLHAAYERLSYKEKQRLTNLINQTYNDLTDPNLDAKVKLYKDSGSDITNELHSILGTEIVKLPSELENYYKRYFTDRQAVVSLALHYQAEFTNRKNKVIAYDQQLAEIEKKVNQNNIELESQQRTLQAESSRLDVLLSSGNIDSYNSGVATYNQKVEIYRVLLGTTRSLVDQYKTVLAERNRVAVEAQELNKALDSRIQTKASDIN